MSSNITLSAGVRQNLLSLQNTASMMSTTQNRLATGKKVNTALDNPTNFFTSSSLQSRASDLSSLLDSMSNGIKTLEAADNGLTSITTTVESMQSTLRQARQDKSFKTASYELDTTAIGTSSVKNISFSGGAVGDTAVDVALNSAGTTAVNATVSGTGGFAAGSGNDEAGTAGSFTIQAANLNGGNAVTVNVGATDKAADVVDSINNALDAATGGDGSITASINGGQIVLTGTTGNNITVGGTAGVLGGIGLAAGTSSDGHVATTGSVKSVDEIVASINSNSSLTDKIRASNDNGKLRIENLSTSDLTVTGVAASTGKADGTTGTGSIDGNDVRKNLVKQFNELRDQLNKLADDASFNGINLLRGDKLKITFNETGTSTLEIQAKDTAGNVRGIDTSDDSLNIDEVSNSEFDSDSTIDGLLDNLGDALSTLRSQASAFGSNLSAVQNRQDFTKSMINTLQTGADNLTLADSNEEGANMLALQTRQQLSTTALSLASQADQAVLRLF